MNIYTVSMSEHRANREDREDRAYAAYCRKPMGWRVISILVCMSVLATFNGIVA